MLRTLAVFVLCFCISVNASSRTEEIRMGGIKVVIPAPNGFVSLRSVSPTEFQRLSRIFSESVNTVSIFVEDKYVAELMKRGTADISRFYAVHAPESGNLDLTYERFREVRDRLKKRLAKNDGNKLLNELEEKRAIDYSALGIFYDNNYSIGYLDIVNNNLRSNKAPAPDVVLLTTNIVNVGRLLLFNTYSQYNTPDDLKWIKKTSESWSKDIYQENNIFANEDWREKLGNILDNKKQNY